MSNWKLIFKPFGSSEVLNSGGSLPPAGILIFNLPSSSESVAFWNSRNPLDFGISEKRSFSEDLGEALLLPRLKKIPTEI